MLVSSNGAVSRDTVPFSPSMTMITSSFAFPWISRASNPVNFRYGPKKPPTLQSQRILVEGETLKQRDFPEPAYWVVPQSGPVVMSSSFSGLSHRVEDLQPSHMSLRPNPRPPVNSFFISSVTGFSVILPVPRFTYNVRFAYPLVTCPFLYE